MDDKHERWAAGDAYEQFMGRWSREVAVRFLRWLDVPPRQRWLDLGCGTGALTQTIAALSDPQALVGLDSSADFAQYASQQTDAARFVVADGSALPLAGQSFDAVVSGLVLNFIPQPALALSEMRRIIKPDGLAAAYVWDYADKMEFLRYFWDTASALDPTTAPLHEGSRFPLCRPDALRQLWVDAGLHEVLVDPLDIPAVFVNFDAYWRPFTVGSFPAPKYAAALSETDRRQLRDRLQAVLPVEPDGAIRLTARVWAVRGYR